MGEHIADLGGVAIALDAYHPSLRGRPTQVIDGLLGWEPAWRSKVRDEFMRRRAASDTHSPRQYRVDGVI